PVATRRFTSPLELAMRTPFALSCWKNDLACSSPHAANSAAACIVVVPKSGLAIATCPFQRGSIRSLIDFGRSPEATRFLLTRKSLARAAKPVQLPSAALNAAGMPAALGER